MSWFNEERVFVSSSVVPLVDDTPDNIKQSVINSVLTGRDIVPDLLDSYRASIAHNMDNYYRAGFYGDDPNNPRFAPKFKWSNGLPKGDTGFEPVNKDEVQRILEQRYPDQAAKGITVLSAGYYTYTQDDYQAKYDMVKGAIMRNEGVSKKIEFTQILNGGVYFILNDGLEWELDPTFDKIRPQGTTFKIRGRSWNSGGESGQGYWQHSDDFTVKQDYPLVWNQRYVLVNYTVEGEKYTFPWVYQVESKEYPQLTPEAPKTTYMPVIPLRLRNRSIQPEDAIYPEAKKMLKYFNIKVKHLIDSIEKSEDIDSIDHAYFTLVVDVFAEGDPITNYLFEFFRDMDARSTATRLDFVNYMNIEHPRGAPNFNEVNIKDKTFNSSLFWLYTTNTVQDEVIGKVGTVKKVITPNGSFKHWTWREHESGWVKNQEIRIESPDSTLTLTKQISETQTQTIVVHGLMYADKIYQGRGKYWIATLSDSADEDLRKILVPMNVAILYESLSKKEREYLIYKSFNLVVHAVEVIKLKWYETSIFQGLVKIIGIAITIISFGMDQGLGFSIAQAISAGVTAVATLVGEMILANIILSYTFKFAAEALGVEWAALFAAVVVAVGIIGDRLGTFELPDITDFLSMITSGLGSGTGAVIQEELEQIQSESEKLKAEQEKLWEELEEAQEQIQDPSILDPLYLFTDIGIFPWESGSDWVNRQLKVDYAQESIDAVSNFVDNALMMPYSFR